jgi:hypothetical protein
MLPWWILIAAIVVGLGVLAYFKTPRRDNLPWASEDERRSFKERSGKPHEPPPADFSGLA